MRRRYREPEGRRTGQDAYRDPVGRQYRRESRDGGRRDSLESLRPESPLGMQVERGRGPVTATRSMGRTK